MRTIVLVGLLGIFAGPLVSVLQSGIDSFAIVCAWQLAGLFFGLAIGCVVLPVLGVAPSWVPPLELAPVPELGCVLSEGVVVNCCVLAPLEAAGPSGAVALFPPLENGGADVSVLLLVLVIL